jgi:hypothetical protein
MTWHLCAFAPLREIKKALQIEINFMTINSIGTGIVE